MVSTSFSSIAMLAMPNCGNAILPISADSSQATRTSFIERSSKCPLFVLQPQNLVLGRNNRRRRRPSSWTSCPLSQVEMRMKTEKWKYSGKINPISDGCRSKMNLFGSFGVLDFALLASSSSADSEEKISKDVIDSSSTSLSSSSNMTPPGKSESSTILTVSMSENSTKSSTTSSSKSYPTVEVTKMPKTSKMANESQSKDSNGDSIKNEMNINEIANHGNIPGLLSSPSFVQYSRRHCTIILLSKHLPTLLELPASSASLSSLSSLSAATSTEQQIYDPNIQVTGPQNEELAIGIEEIVGVTRALAVVATGARRAASFTSLATGLGGLNGMASGSSGMGSGQIECEILMDPNDSLNLMVLWRTRLPSSGIFGVFPTSQSSASESDREYTEFSGKSLISLSATTGLVHSLQILQWKVNGVSLMESRESPGSSPGSMGSLSSLGGALATIRSAAKSVLASSSFLDSLVGGRAGKEGGAAGSGGGNPFLDGMLSGLQRELSAVMDVVDSSTAKEEGEVQDGKLYVSPQNLWKNASFPVERMDERLTETNATVEQNQELSSFPVPIDEYSDDAKFPLVGSTSFVEYSNVHLAFQKFVQHGLPKLVGSDVDGREESAESIRALFSTNVDLITFGANASPSRKDEKHTRSVSLLRSAGQIGDLYRSLSLLRQASGGDWNIVEIQGDWRTRTLVVSWKADVPVRIEGQDAFVFENPSLFQSNICLPLATDGDKEAIATQCAKYFVLLGLDLDGESNFINAENANLKIERVENRKLTVGGVVADSEWAKLFVAAVLNSNFVGNTPIPDPTIMELLTTLTRRRSSSKTNKPTNKKARKASSTTSTMPNLDEKAAASFYGILRSLHQDLNNIGMDDGSLPAVEYLAESVELRGLLSEVLVRGQTSYNRLLAVVLSSFRAALKTNRVRLAVTPRPIVEVTSRGSIKVDFIMGLSIDAPKFPMDARTNGGFGVPLKLEFISEYIVDSDGLIREHRLLESRINGILTPGDVFSRWVKSLIATNSDEDEGVGGVKSVPSALESLMDVISWAKSMQNRK